MNSLILDFIVLAILIAFMILGFKSGVIKSFLGFVGVIFASFLSVYVASKFANWIYFDVLSAKFEKEIEYLILKNSINFNSIISKVPVFFSNSLPQYGITPSAVNHIIYNNTQTEISDKIIQLFAPLIINNIKSLITVILFFVFNIVIKFIFKLILKVFNLSLFKGADRLLGGIFGVLKGYMVIVVCMCCLRVVILHRNDMPKLFSAESISGTVIFKEIYNNNFIYEFFNKI